MTHIDTPREPSPYDTGERAEPKVWPVAFEGKVDLDRYGRVDFDDDESATIATVRVQRTPDGRYELIVDADPDVVIVRFEHELGGAQPEVQAR